jgi:hypothetical protein
VNVGRLMRDAMPTDPREWWTGDETDEYISAWLGCGLPHVPMADATGSVLTLWIAESDIDTAATMLGEKVGRVGDAAAIRVIEGDYEVCVIADRNRRRDGNA